MKGLLEPWAGATLDELLTMCSKITEDPEYPTVKRWREQGGQVLGHFQVYFPEELAHAAGMLPLKIRGAPVEPRYSDSRFGSYLCSIIKTSLELALTERITLEMFVTHPICDAARNLGAVWGRNFPYKCQILYLPQNPNSSYSATYLAGEYRRILGDIEEVTGAQVTDEMIAASLAVYNENRRLIRELYRIKRETPWKLSSYETYSLVSVGGMIRREEHNELLQALVPLLEARETKAQDKVKIVFQGGFCEQPPYDLLKAIDRSCYVVDDDLLIGMRYILTDVIPDGDPVAALAKAYIDQSSYSPVQHDLNKRKEDMLMEVIRGSGAEAAIISAAKMCEPGLEEQVTYSYTLDEAGMPYFITEFEENMTSLDSIELQLETFVENILFD